MGLAERRAAKEFETKKFPELKKKNDDAAGFAVSIDVQWDKLTLEGQAHLYDECWEKIYFEPLEAALKHVAVDEMGKEALKQGLKKVVITNTDSVHYGDRMSKLESGVLTLDHKPTTNVGDLNDRVNGIQKTLENAL
jgi:hypothetical protein